MTTEPLPCVAIPAPLRRSILCDALKAPSRYQVPLLKLELADAADALRRCDCEAEREACLDGLRRVYQ